MLRYASNGAHLFEFLASNVILRRSVSTFTPRTTSKDEKERKTESASFAGFPLSSSDPAVLSVNIKSRLSDDNTNGSNVTNLDLDIFNTTVNALRHALKTDKRVHTIWKEWSILRDRHLLRFLGPLELDAISNLLVKLCSRNSQISWDSEERRMVEDIAVTVAANGATEALITCMLWHIKKKDSDAALELSARYARLRAGSNVAVYEEEVDEQIEDPALIVSDIGDNESTDKRSGSTVLLATITAYASQDNFLAALEASPNSVIRRHQWAIADYLQRLDYDRVLQQKLETYLDRIETARLVARADTLAKRISNLAKGQTVGVLEKFYRNVVDGLLEPDGYLASSPSAVSHCKPIFVPEVFWHSCLTGFIKCRRFELAHAIWDDMHRAGYHAGVGMWTALLNGYDSIGAVEEATKAWDSMASQNVEPDTLTYRAYISILFNAKRHDAAMYIFADFERVRASKQLSSEDSKVLAVYNTVLNGLLWASREDKAGTIMQAMISQGPRPDIITYNTFLRYYARSGNFKKLASTVNEISAAGLHGDVFTFSTLLAALLKVGREDAKEVTFSLMEKHGIKPNVATYSAIINHLMREQDEKSLRGALSLLRRMESTPDLRPNEVTYTSILSGIYRGSWLSTEVMEECSQYVWGRMKTQKMLATRATYHILIKASLQNPLPMGLQNALNLYRELRSTLSLTDSSCLIVLQGLVRRGEWALANEISVDMQRSGIQPQGALLSLMVRIRRRAAR